jgi:hypothetical protein
MSVVLGLVVKMWNLKYYISKIRATMFAAPLSGWSMVRGFSQSHAGASAVVSAGGGMAFACLACSEQNIVTASSIPSIIRDVFSLFMLVCFKGCPSQLSRADVIIKLQPTPALCNRMNV